MLSCTSNKVVQENMACLQALLYYQLNCTHIDITLGNYNLIQDKKVMIMTHHPIALACLLLPHNK